MESFTSLLSRESAFSERTIRIGLNNSKNLKLSGNVCKST